nr:MAG TPA_asm: hypothetical protein [Caudoviricetes sp.]
MQQMLCKVTTREANQTTLPRSPSLHQPPTNRPRHFRRNRSLHPLPNQEAMRPRCTHSRRQPRQSTPLTSKRSHTSRGVVHRRPRHRQPTRRHCRCSGATHGCPKTLHAAYNLQRLRKTHASTNKGQTTRRPTTNPRSTRILPHLRRTTPPRQRLAIHPTQKHNHIHMERKTTCTH